MSWGAHMYQIGFSNGSAKSPWKLPGNHAPSLTRLFAFGVFHAIGPLEWHLRAVFP